jgi:hypothetical protein
MNQTPGSAVLIVVLALAGLGVLARSGSGPAVGTGLPATARR